MAHLPAQESDIEKVIRIAKGLGISIEDAAVTCDAFELAFSNEGLRRSIFEMIDQLDESAARKGEPFGLIITYAVELGQDGIRVGRYADEIPVGQVVTLTPSDRARVLLRIKDNFPTQEYLGPIIVNRPVDEFENEEMPEFLRDSEPDDVLSDKSQIQNPKSQIECVICLGPIRLTFDERFPIVSANASETLRNGAMPLLSSAGRTAHLPPRAALQAANLALQLTSGLSPPLRSGEPGHSQKAKDVPTGPG